MDFAELFDQDSMARNMRSRTQRTILCVDAEEIICYVVTGNSGIDQSRLLRLNN